MNATDKSLPPLKHTARQYWLVEGLCELALKRQDRDYYLEALDSFAALEPSMATHKALQLFKRILFKIEKMCDVQSAEPIMREAIAELAALRERAVQEEANAP